MTDLSNAHWHKASASSSGTGGCVEIASNLPGITAIRDSTRPHHGTHLTTPTAFAALLHDIKNGTYDLQHQIGIEG
jgi:hypothetical protein